LSKLYDQLKQAARQRGEEPEAGLLAQALQARRDAQSGPLDPAAMAPAQPAAAPQQAAPPPRRRFPRAPVLLTVAIFIAVLMAWRAAPWHAPAKLRIDPAALKLDSRLDDTRVRKTNTH
jgi:hypothetical protein